MPVNPLTRWTVYGRLRTGVNLDGRVTTRGFHAEKLTSMEAAVHYVMSGFITHGAALDAVVVELKYGEDKHEERTVIHRVGQGKAWWE